MSNEELDHQESDDVLSLREKLCICLIVFVVSGSLLSFGYLLGLSKSIINRTNNLLTKTQSENDDVTDVRDFQVKDEPRLSFCIIANGVTSLDCWIGQKIQEEAIISLPIKGCVPSPILGTPCVKRLTMQEFVDLLGYKYQEMATTTQRKLVK